jgi:hypothetical protein
MPMNPELHPVVSAALLIVTAMIGTGCSRSLTEAERVKRFIAVARDGEVDRKADLEAVLSAFFRRVPRSERRMFHGILSVCRRSSIARVARVCALRRRHPRGSDTSSVHRQADVWAANQGKSCGNGKRRPWGAIWIHVGWGRGVRDQPRDSFNTTD